MTVTGDASKPVECEPAQLSPTRFRRGQGSGATSLSTALEVANDIEGWVVRDRRYHAFRAAY